MATLGNARLVCVLYLAVFVSAWTHGDVIPLYVSFRRKDSQHKSTPTALPKQNLPRFGVHRSITIPSFHLDAASFATNLTERQYLHEHSLPAVNMKINFGPLTGATPWLPLVNPTSTAMFLGHLTIFFNCRMGVFGDVKQITFERRYVTHATDLTLEYVWRDVPAYDADLAVSVTCAISILIALLVAMKITAEHVSSPFGKYVVVRDRSD